MNASMKMDFDAAVANLVERCHESRDTPANAFDGEMLEALTPAGLREAARIGIMRVAGDQLHNERTQRDEKTNASVRGYTADGRNSSSHRDSLRIALMGVDGKLTALMEFTADDCELLRVNSLSLKAAWRSREKWATRAQQLLAQNRRASKVKDLRKEHLTELRQLAEEAWS